MPENQGNYRLQDILQQLESGQNIQKVYEIGINYTLQNVLQHGSQN